MKRSTELKNQINELQGKKEKLDAFVKQLNGVKISKSLAKQPDKEKMDGDKYDQHHTSVKTIFSNCKSSVNSEINEAVSALQKKSAEYAVEISNLEVSRSVAIALEAAEELAEKAAKEAKKLLHLDK